MLTEPLGKSRSTPKSASPNPADPIDEAYDCVLDLLKRYTPPFQARTGTVKGKRDYHLYSRKEVMVAGREFDEMCFVSVIRQAGFVGFYFMPIYCQPELREELSPELLKLLKGKTCFHIKKVDEKLRADIIAALDLGLKTYQSNGWA